MALLDDLDRIDREREEPTAITPSMERAPSSLVSDLETMEKDITEQENRSYLEGRGFFSGLASDVAGGVLDYGKMGLQAVRALTPQTGPEPEPGSLRATLTSGIEGIEKFKEQHPFFQETPGQEGVSRAVHGGVRSFTQSLAAGLPTAVAGAAAGSALGPVGTAVGGVLGYALGGATQFGLAQYEDVMERGIKQKMDEGMSFEDARTAVEPAAVREAVYEGGFEGASDLLSGFTMGAGKLLSSVGKEALKGSIKDLTRVGFGQFAKRALGVAGIETGSEMLTAGAQAEEEKAIGLGTSDFWDAAKDAFGPAFVASTLFAGLGHVNTKVAQRQLIRALEDPTVDPKQRAIAAKEVEKVLAVYDPKIADVWGKTADSAISGNQSISTNDQLIELQQKIVNLETIPEKARTETQRQNLTRYQQERDAILAGTAGPEEFIPFPVSPAATAAPAPMPQGAEAVQEALTEREMKAVDALERKVENLSQIKKPTPVQRENLTKYQQARDAILSGKARKREVPSFPVSPAATVTARPKKTPVASELDRAKAALQEDEAVHGSIVPGGMVAPSVVETPAVTAAPGVPVAPEVRGELVAIPAPVEPVTPVAAEPAPVSVAPVTPASEVKAAPEIPVVSAKEIAPEAPEITAPEAKPPVSPEIAPVAAPVEKMGEVSGEVAKEAKEGKGEGRQEPWRMTRGEFIQQAKEKMKAKGNKFLPEGHGFGTERDFEVTAIVAYRQHVENALKEGKPVSKEVLAQFPDLAQKEAGHPSAFRVEHDAEGNVRGVITDAKGNEHSSIWYEPTNRKRSEQDLKERAFKAAVFAAKRRYGTPQSSEQAELYRQKQNEFVRDLSAVFRPEGRPEIIAEAEFEGTKYQMLILPQILESGAVAYKVFTQHPDGSSLGPGYPSHQSSTYDSTAEEFGASVSDDTRYVIHDPAAQRGALEKKADSERREAERKAEEERIRQETAAALKRDEANAATMKGVKFKTVELTLSTDSGKKKVTGKAIGEYAYHRPLGYDPKYPRPYVITHIPSGTAINSTMADNQAMARELTYRLSRIEARWNGKGKPSKAFLDSVRAAVQGFMDGSLIEEVPAAKTEGEPLPSLKVAPPSGLSRIDVSAVVSPIASRWAKNPTAPRIEIAHRFENLPQGLQSMFRHNWRQVKGLYSPRYRTIYIVAENIDTPVEVEETMLHEGVGHHGMRLILGDRLEPFLKEVVSLYGKKGLQDIADLYGFDLETEKGRMSAAEEKIAGMAETGERPGFIRRLIAEIREALRDMGFTIKLSDNDVKAMIARAGKFMETEFDMPEKVKAVFPLEAAKQAGEVRPSLKSSARTELVSTFKAVSRHLGERTETGFLGRLFITPEHWKNPVGKAIFDAAQGKQEDRHQILNNVLKIPELTDTIKKFMFTGKNWLTRQKGYDFYDQSKAPKDYRDYGHHLDFMDRNNLKWNETQKDASGKAIEPYRDRLIREGKVSREVIAAIDKTREMLDAALELQRADIKELLDQYERQGKPVPVVATVKNAEGKSEQVTLKDLYNQMGFLKGSYSPRIREAGDWFVTSQKGGNRYRFHQGSARAAYKFAERLKREGHANVGEPQRIERLPESVYQDITIPEIQAAVDRAVKGAELDPETEAKIRQTVLENAADILKERGFRAHKIARSEGPVVRGYITDPLTRNLMYAQQTAGGIAKSKAASKMFGALMGEGNEYSREGDKWVRRDDGGKELDSIPLTAEELKSERRTKRVHTGGIDPKKEPERYTVYTEYIQEMLRNPDASDRFIALGKSLVSFKYLGLSPRSALANVTALVTTVPPAIHQYAMQGKGSMTRIGAELTRACRDYAKVMAGKTLPNAKEQAFLDEVQGSSDLEQYTREAMSHLAGAYGKSWQAVMNKSMWMFGKSEAWIRGSTMLAAYRLARGLGASHEEAAKRAKESSNRAHGIYSEASQPLWTMGSNPAAKIGKMGMTYLKFAHNYIQMMYDLGMRKKNVKAFTFAFLSPAVLAGSSATLATPVAIALGGAMLKALGDDRDPEKFVFDIIRDNIGGEAERFARFGLLGMAGIDISGSLAIGLEPPKTLMDLTGPFGGVAQDIASAGHFIATGQPGRAAERAMPTFAGNMLRAARELKGATTSSGARVWDEEGKPYIPTVAETAGRVVGFRSGRRATVEARERESKREATNYADRRRNIYERYRAYVASKEADSASLQGIMDSVAGYNRSVFDAGLQRIIPLITAREIKNQLRRMEQPGKRRSAIIASYREGE